MSNFLPVPPKRAVSIPNLSQSLLSYITNHFRDAHPEAFRKDVEALVAMRRDWVETKAEAHPEIVKGLMRYHAQLAFLATKFPADVGVAFAYHLPYAPPFSLTSDVAVSLPSLTFERCSVLFNIAALYATMAAAERRTEAEGIKRALGYLSSAAGVLDYLISNLLQTLMSECSTPAAAGYDMTESFLGCVRDFLLAEAQECYWQQAVLQGTYKNGVIAKLSMKVSEYYKSALASASGTDTPSSGYLPQNWTAHVTVKQVHFETAAQYRLSQEDLEKRRYGDEVARLKIAEGLAKKGIDAGKRGVAETVISDLKNLQAAVKSALDRAVRDNDLIYNATVPPPTQLSPIVGAAMVKLAPPKEVAEPVAWLMGGGAGHGPLFSQLVPYGVHLALSIYDDRKDNLIRQLDGQREELDGLAASTLQSLNLPGSIQALERPGSLPPSLLHKAEEVDRQGGIEKIRELLAEVERISRSNARILSEAMDILDQEAHENEQLLQQQPHLAQTRQPSHVANQHLIGMSQQYDGTIKQAANSDGTVKEKWDQWRPLIDVLAGGEGAIEEHVPSTTGHSSASLPSSVRPLRASLEDLDDLINLRSLYLTEARQISAADDVRPAVLQAATKLAHGGTGDVKPEAFESIFDKSLEKYDKVRREMQDAGTKQDQLLDQIRAQNEAFLAERKDDPRVRERESRLQEMDMAYWKWREISDNAEEGIKFHQSFAEMLGSFKEACAQFLRTRRMDVGQLSHSFGGLSMSPAPSNSSSPPPGPSYPSSIPPQPAFSLPHPSSTSWQTADNLLPPPPPPPILRSGGIQTQARPPPRTSSTTSYDTPKRVTRSQTGATPGRGPIGDAERNPYKSTGGTRKDGGVV